MSTSQPDVSVIVPVGAVDAVLERQVRAIVEQQLDRPFELVLSLNVSDAAAAAELDRMLAAIGDGCVRVVDSSDRKGAAHARNVGIRASVGRLVACCDADDMVHAGWLAALVLGLADHDAVSGHVIDVFPEPHMAKWHPPATPDSLPTFLGVRRVTPLGGEKVVGTIDPPREPGATQGKPGKPRPGRKSGAGSLSQDG